VIAVFLKSDLKNNLVVFLICYASAEQKFQFVLKLVWTPKEPTHIPSSWSG